MKHSYLTLGALGLALLVGVIRLLRVGRRPKGYPPGPPTIPVLGNLHLMPSKDVHLQFQKWAQEYGDVFSLILGTNVWIVLNSDEAIKELLDRRSGIYSSRLDMYIGQTLCSDGMRLLMMQYGPIWRMERRMVHSLLNVSNAKRFVPYQVLENKQMLNDLLDTPDDKLKHIRRYSNALTTSMVFGWRTHTYEDPNMQQLFDGFSEFAVINSTGIAALVDFFPVLRRLPDFMNPTQKKAKDLHKEESELYLKHWLNAKEATKNGTVNHCFCEGMVEVQEKEGFNDKQAAYISGTLLEAGSDTTSCTLYGFVQAMLLYPEVQRKAQACIDAVCGDSRLPTMEDEPSLPYVRCMIKETLRWMPTTILGAVPHATTQDDTYKGYFIPKGAGVLNNVWTVNNHPSRTNNRPRVFDPDRYQDDELSLYDSASNPDGKKRDMFTFGAGRRVCPGIHVAERSLFLGMSRLLWAFNISPKLDSAGEPMLPDQEKLTQGFVCMPEPYECNITPRSEERTKIIREEWADAEKLLDPETKQWLKSPY